VTFDNDSGKLDIAIVEGTHETWSLDVTFKVSSDQLATIAYTLTYSFITNACSSTHSDTSSDVVSLSQARCDCGYPACSDITERASPYQLTSDYFTILGGLPIQLKTCTVTASNCPFDTPSLVSISGLDNSSMILSTDIVSVISGSGDEIKFYSSNGLTHNVTYSLTYKIKW